MKSATRQFMEHMELFRRNRYNSLQGQRQKLLRQMIYLLEKMNVVEGSTTNVEYVVHELVNRIFKYPE
jgi:hypothetical protein